MGSLTDSKQIDADKAMAERNAELGIDQAGKRELRSHIQLAGIPESSDSWWKEAQRNKAGIYSG